MKKWPAIVVTSLGILFGSAVLLVQFFDLHREKYDSMALSQLCVYQSQLSAASSVLARDQSCIPLSAFGRQLDLVLPANARTYMADMLGSTNSGKSGYYYFLSYYLFPREVSQSVDGVVRFTKEGFQGRAAENDDELKTAGFDVKVTFGANANPDVRLLRQLPTAEPRNPDWFDSTSDWLWAFLLPPLTACAGLLLLRMLFASLAARLAPMEQFACGLGLGMVAVAALTLGFKLVGLHAYGFVAAILVVASAYELWTRRTRLLALSPKGLAEVLWNPVALVMALLFIVLFRLASLEGVLEFDAVAFWLLKAKMFHLCTGSEIIKWFAEPRFAYAHMDYPTLMPALHATLWDTLGHVDDFVSKFWPVWMLVALVTALFSMLRTTKENAKGLPFLLLGLALMPASVKYALMEGGTIPMVFFTTLGCVQIAAALSAKDRERLGLGLILLFGAAMTKFEGVIILALGVGWVLLLPSTRALLTFNRRSWGLVLFCALAALPFAWLRLHTPALHYESGWLKEGAHDPLAVLVHWPQAFIALVTRWFLDTSFAPWTFPEGRIHWAPQWQGFGSLFHHPTLGLSWVALGLTIVAFMCRPARRGAVIWVVATVFGMIAALSGVFSCFANASDIGTVVMGFTGETVSARYLLPILVAWASAMTVLLYLPEEAPAATPDPAVASPRAAARKDMAAR